MVREVPKDLWISMNTIACGSGCVTTNDSEKVTLGRKLSLHKFLVCIGHRPMEEVCNPGLPR